MTLNSYGYSRMMSGNADHETEQLGSCSPLPVSQIGETKRRDTMAGRRRDEDEGDGQRTYWRVRIAIEVMKGVAWAVWEEARSGRWFPWL